MSNVNDTLTVTKSLILSGAGNVTVDGIVLGAYQGGVVMTYAEDSVFIDSDHVMGHIRAVKTNTTIQIATELEQGGLENIALSYGIPTSSVLSGASSKILSLTPASSMIEHSLVFTGMSATNLALNRTFTLHVAIRVGSSGNTYYRTAKLVLPVTFECLPNSTGEFGTVVDATI